MPARGCFPLVFFGFPRSQGETSGLIGHAHQRPEARCGHESKPFAGEYAGLDAVVVDGNATLAMKIKPERFLRPQASIAHSGCRGSGPILWP